MTTTSHITSREEWRPIIGFEGKYEVSNLGRVRSLARMDAEGKRLAQRILKPWMTTPGYVQVNLVDGARKRVVGVHRLVVEAFVGEIPTGCEVDHANGVKTDNSLSNLAVVTRSQNVRRARRLPNKRRKLSAEDARTIRGIRRSRATYPEIAARFGVCTSSISHICNRRTWV